MLKPIKIFSLLFLSFGFLVASFSLQASNEEQGSTQVMQAFTSSEVTEGEAVAIADQTKREIMFIMGIPLLLLIIVTTALGVAMGVYGKPVFVAHMICAGFSLTLAFAHAVVGLVWFYPF
jgi:hypothetical protein